MNSFKKKIIEETLLLVEIVKWTFLSALVGILVGVSTTVFLKLIDFGLSFDIDRTTYLFLLPLGGLLTGVLIHFLAPKAEGHGTEAVIREVHKSKGDIQPKIAPVKMIASLITIITGGSVGKEGPAAQIGGSIASTVSKLIKLSPDSRKKLVICGISAGFSSVFGTPIAGAIFGIEVLFLGQVMYSVIYPSFVSGIVAYSTARHFGINYVHNNIDITTEFSKTMFFELILAGIFFGLVTLFFIESLKLSSKFFRSLNLPKYVRPMIGGLILSMLIIFGFSTQNLGLGTNVIHSVLEGNSVGNSFFLEKILFTSLTLGSGGSGGIITPLFVVGASSGFTFSRIFGLSAILFAAIGMIAVLAAATNTPLASSVLAIEMFGPEAGVFASLSIIVSYIICGHRSVYDSQIIYMKKGDYFNIGESQELGELKEIKPKIYGRFKRIVNWFNKHRNN